MVYLGAPGATRGQGPSRMADPALTCRIGVPDDIARVVAYLASDEASWVSGKVFQIDGGIEAANVDLGLPDL